MPNYICRFCAIEQPGGMFLIVPRPPARGEVGKFALKLTASKPVTAPTHVLSEIEVHIWVKENGDKSMCPATPWENAMRLAIAGVHCPFDGPAIEEVVDKDEVLDNLARVAQRVVAALPANSVRSWLCWQDDEIGSLGVAIEVTNHSNETLLRVKISWMDQFGQARGLFYPIVPVAVSCSGVFWEADIAAGATVRFMADAEAVDGMRKAVAHSPPDAFRLCVVVTEGKSLEAAQGFFGYGRSPIGTDAVVGAISGEKITELLQLPEIKARERSNPFIILPEEETIIKGFDDWKAEDPTLSCFAIVIRLPDDPLIGNIYDLMSTINQDAFAGRPPRT